MDKLTTEEIIKIIWGDLDRKLFGNLFYRINKRIKDNFTPVYYGNIKYNKKTIIKELRSCNFTCSDIQKIREIINNSFREELYDIKMLHHISPCDIIYTDTNFVRYSLSFLRSDLTEQLNNNARKNASSKIDSWLNHYKPYNNFDTYGC